MMQSLPKSQKAVAIWMYAGVAMLLVQVVLGGITRLTGSGLSITEWKVLEGALPPLSQQQWAMAFAKYRQTPQYLLLNNNFSLQDYKFIYFWEWFHREWARLIGFVFVGGFIYLLRKKYLQAGMIKPLLVLFLLGAVQGAIGWIMVKSGLTDDMIYVKPLKLALHFVFALTLLCYTWWLALDQSVTPGQWLGSASLRNSARIILILLFFQLIYGALMAGYKAANVAPTWPDINGSWLPEKLFSPSINLLENKITIHFMHRGLAYLLVLLTAVWTLQAMRIKARSPLFQKIKWLPAGLVLLQAVLGILTVISSPAIVPNRWVMFDWMAQLHQVIAMAYMLAMVSMLYLAGKQPAA